MRIERSEGENGGKDVAGQVGVLFVCLFFVFVFVLGGTFGWGVSEGRK